MTKDKYKILKEDSITIAGHKLYRIKALVDINPNTLYGQVKAGEIGGYIQSTDNLSQDGNCWVFDQAKVFGDATIEDNAIICDRAQVYDNAIVNGNAVIRDDVKIYECAAVSGNASIYSNAKIHGDAMIHGKPTISDNVDISGHAIVYGQARVYNSAKVGDNAFLDGNVIVGKTARIFGDVHLFGDATISDSVLLTNKDSYICVGPIGSRNDTLTAYMNDNRIRLHIGCFTGTLKQFLKRVHESHRGTIYESQYLKAVELIELSLCKSECEQE